MVKSIGSWARGYRPDPELWRNGALGTLLKLLCLSFLRREMGRWRCLALSRGLRREVLSAVLAHPDGLTHVSSCHMLVLSGRRTLAHVHEVPLCTLTPSGPLPGRDSSHLGTTTEPTWERQQKNAVKNQHTWKLTKIQFTIMRKTTHFKLKQLVVFFASCHFAVDRWAHLSVLLSYPSQHHTTTELRSQIFQINLFGVFC